MDFRSKKPLRKLSKNEFNSDVKKFIRSTHKFYDSKIPEIKTLAKKMQEEYELKEFYKVFRRLWNSGYHGERSLAIKTLLTYENEFDKKTWNFLIPFLNDIGDFDEADAFGEIIGKILVRNDLLKREIKKLSKRKNILLKRVALVSCFPLVKKRDLDFIFKILGERINDKERKMQEINGKLLSALSKVNKRETKKFILKHKDMSELTFEFATENLKELRKSRNVKKLGRDKRGFLFLKFLKE